MSRREVVVSALAVVTVALVARVLVAGVIGFPRPEDTAYYVGVARNLLDGRGLVSDALWSYATPPLVFPRPAFEIWLPLPTFLAVIPMALFGPSFTAAQVSSVLVGSLVPVLAWRLAADVAAERGLPAGRARTLALGVGLTSAVYLPLLLHSALPDSTMPFAVLALATCLLMTRILSDPRGARVSDRRVLAVGVLLGLTALTRNEAIWLALTWAGLAWFTSGLTPAARLRLIGVAAAAALVVFAPWAYRDWLVFGNPLPGQAALNALSLHGLDIFAWNDRPTLDRYLAAGVPRLLELRVVGLGHNLLNVLLIPGAPLAVIGVLALPWAVRGRAVRPVAILAAVTLLFTGLVFPVSTTWGTFLHAAGPAHILVILSALLALDAGIARLAVVRHWTRPVAWLGPVFGIAGSVVLSAVFLGQFGRDTRDVERRFEELGARMEAIGRPLDGTAGPVVSDFPVWIAETRRISSLALPDEPPMDVLDLARSFPGTRLVLLVDPTEYLRWPADVDAGALGAECFRELDLGPPTDPRGPDPLATTRVFEIVCP